MQNLTFNTQNEIIDVTKKDKEILKSLAKIHQFSEKFILENVHLLDWNIVSENQILSIKIMVKYASKIKWAKVSINNYADTEVRLVATYKGNLTKLLDKENLSDDFLRTYKDLFIWKNQNTKNISNNFLEEVADQINWRNVFIYDKNDEAFVRKNLFRIDEFLNPNIQHYIWNQISQYQSVSEQFLRDFETKINFHLVGISKVHKLSDAFVEDFKYILLPKDIIKTQSKNLSKQYLTTYKKFDLEAFYKNTNEEWIKSQPESRINWEYVAKFTTLSEEFIFDFLEKLKIRYLLRNKTFSEEFIRKISPRIDKYDWQDFFIHQSHSESFLIENLSNVSLGYISGGKTMKNLSENFIRQYQSQWDWKEIVKVKQFSEAFLREFQHKWDWKILPHFQNLSEEMKREFVPEITLDNTQLMDYYNKKAWEVFETEKNNPQKLEQGLEWVEKALLYAPKTFYDLPAHIADTKVRLLLALNRNEEAFAIVQKILRGNFYFKDFQEFKTNETYLEWLKNNP